MTASEFAFLALGLVLGIASGAALIEVLRARPPAAREVRVTVAPNAIQRRSSATLAEPAAAFEPTEPAIGGPGDPHSGDEDDAPAPASTNVQGAAAIAPVARSNGTHVPSEPAQANDDRSSAAVGPHAAADRPDPLWLGTARRPELVPVPMSLEPDPLTSALRATAAASAVAAMAGSIASRTTDPHEQRPSAGSASSDRDVSTHDTRAAGWHRGGGLSPADRRAGSAERRGSAPLPNGEEPCAEERRVADERCAVAAQARIGAGSAAESLERVQRTHDDHVARAEAAAAAADPRAVRSAKEEAQRLFHEARGSARTRDDVEAAARTWLAEINRINHDARDAAQAAERDRAAAAALVTELERLAVEADAARMAAELADEACQAARDSVAACAELESVAADDPGNRGRSPSAAPAGPERRRGTRERRIGPATPEPEEEFAFSTPMTSGGVADAPILRILRGDREALQHVVDRLAGGDPDAQRRWQTLVAALADALIARSIEASAFDFPTDHFFWGPFSQTQNRDIAAALSSLGFRFDGFGDWVDERIPTQRDLAMAVGYAALDPMRIRRWPTDTESRELLRDIRVAADEYIAGAAGGMTLGELVTLLGRRADGLTEIWNEWARVRPALLEPEGT